MSCSSCSGVPAPAGANDATGIMAMKKALDAQRGQMAALLATLPPAGGGKDAVALSPEALAALAAEQAKG
jgi:hypothetical protein